MPSTSIKTSIKSHKIMGILCSGTIECIGLTWSDCCSIACYRFNPYLSESSDESEDEGDDAKRQYLVSAEYMTHGLGLLSHLHLHNLWYTWPRRTAWLHIVWLCMAHSCHVFWLLKSYTESTPVTLRSVYAFACFNSPMTPYGVMTLWTLHKLMGIYMGLLMLGVIL